MTGWAGELDALRNEGYLEKEDSTRSIDREGPDGR